jgi:hypothetical protein
MKACLAGCILVAAGATGGVLFAAALVVVGGIVWAMVRWPRWDQRLFEPRQAPLVRPQVTRRPVTGLEPAAERHRAFARALHAVSAAYLDECEREVQR